MNNLSVTYCFSHRSFSTTKSVPTSVGCSLQKPAKLMLDNTNQIFSLCSKEPEIGTLRECFFCNQLASAGHKVEYGGIKTGDFRIDNDTL